ncbi:MAG: helix-turn-helix domain-containing protein [Nitrospira sp.]|jgi:excisionase family DNA binding protein|nr:helix-turn-helix domain-containing protein [Nitrospira sp.]MBL8054348.1 helix-turn-helix domain-containing protein [Nitrospira sp.]
MMQTPLPITPRLLDIQQVAVYVGLSVHTVYKFVSQRKIPHVKIGKLVKFDRQEIDRWITAHSVRMHRTFSNPTP